jgi:hypothetical protein
MPAGQGRPYAASPKHASLELRVTERTRPARHLSSHGTSHVTSDLPGLSFDIHSVFHSVIPSVKDFKVTREVTSVTCGGPRGRWPETSALLSFG